MLPRNEILVAAMAPLESSGPSASSLTPTEKSPLTPPSNRVEVLVTTCMPLTKKLPLQADKHRVNFSMGYPQWKEIP